MFIARFGKIVSSVIATRISFCDWQLRVINVTDGKMIPGTYIWRPFPSWFWSKLVCVSMHMKKRKYFFLFISHPSIHIPVNCNKWNMWTCSGKNTNIYEFIEAISLMTSNGSLGVKFEFFIFYILILVRCIF